MSERDVKPVYVLHGSDTFLRDTHRAEIIGQAVGDADSQLCVCSFDATAELAEVLDELRTVPFLAPLRIAVVTDADWLEKSVQAFGWLMPGEVRGFDDDDLDDARAWVIEGLA